MLIETFGHNFDDFFGEKGFHMAPTVSPKEKLTQSWSVELKPLPPSRIAWPRQQKKSVYEGFNGRIIEAAEKEPAK